MTDEQSWLQLAIDARQNAYAAYSNFAVGAAVVTGSGEIFSGCNVENGVLGLSICAERVAICSAVAAGHQQFVAIYIAASPLASPCGSCRQFISEFCGAECKVVAVDAENITRIDSWTLAELLPEKFDFRSIR